MLPKTADIVVIGGGCVGASVAYHLAQRGAKKIVVLEREKFLAMGSTGRATGGVRYQFSTPVNIQLSLYGVSVIEHFEEIVGVSADYRPIGYLFLLTQLDELPKFRASLDLQHRLGATWSHWVEPSEISALTKFIRTDDVLGATFCPKDGVADPNSITTGFAQAATRLGVAFEMETTVTGVELAGDHVAAVETDRGRIETRCLVNACGAWSAEIGKMVHLDIPVAPLRRQRFVTGPIPGFPRDHPFIIEFTSSFHFRPEGDGVHVGMSNRAETPGYKFSIDEAFRDVTFQKAIHRLPLIEHATIAHELAGLYEETPDHHPILGQARAVHGFYVAAGFSGHGVMHSPATGKVMSEIILDGKSQTVDVSELDLERFAEGRLVHELNVV
jgi:sarcosine oxidase subunit beta